MLATVNDGSSSGYHLELTPTEFSLLTELVSIRLSGLSAGSTCLKTAYQRAMLWSEWWTRMFIISEKNSLQQA